MGRKPSDSTFLFADLAGFTALTEAHGDQLAASVAREFCDWIEDVAPEGAEVVKTIGDAVMLRTDDARSAIEFGVQIVEGIGARPQVPTVRVGMHSGPAVEQAGDWFGATVNLAARVSGLAAGDEVLLTAATRGAAGDLEGIDLQALGEKSFKNVKDCVRIFRALRGGERASALPIDPVCRMAVAPDREAGSLSYRGREYHFCSIECVQAFSAAPGEYVAEG